MQFSYDKRTSLCSHRLDLKLTVKLSTQYAMVHKFIDIWDYQSVSGIKSICYIKTRENASYLYNFILNLSC